MHEVCMVTRLKKKCNRNVRNVRHNFLKSLLTRIFLILQKMNWNKNAWICQISIKDLKENKNNHYTYYNTFVYTVKFRYKDNSKLRQPSVVRLLFSVPECLFQ